MGTTTIESAQMEFHHEALAACLLPWLENPRGPFSLLDMLKYSAHIYVRLFQQIGSLKALAAPWALFDAPHNDAMGNPPNKALEENREKRIQLLQEFRATVMELREDCIQLGLNVSAAQIDRIATCKSPSQLAALFEDLLNRISDELKSSVFLKLDSAEIYLYPLERWENALERFGAVAFDVEEAGKSLALGRYTACVFHLMRVVECAVLELQQFLDKPDPRAHFGSVLTKLDHLNTRTKFDEFPERLKPYRQFLIDVLPHLHAVKDSWRNRVSHVDGKIIPTGVFTREMAMGVYEATLLLMKKLADGLPSPS